MRRRSGGAARAGGARNAAASSNDRARVASFTRNAGRRTTAAPPLPPPPPSCPRRPPPPPAARAAPYRTAYYMALSLDARFSTRSPLEQLNAPHSAIASLYRTPTELELLNGDIHRVDVCLVFALSSFKWTLVLTPRCMQSLGFHYLLSNASPHGCNCCLANRQSTRQITVGPGYGCCLHNIGNLFRNWIYYISYLILFKK